MNSAQERIRTVIIEDHKLIAEAWKSMLELQSRFEVVGVFNNPLEGVDAIKTLRPNILLVDINMHPISGIDVTKLVKKFSPGTKVIAVSLLTQPAIVKKIIKAGATGYLTKSSDKSELYTAIDQVLSGHTYICDEVKSLYPMRYDNEIKYLLNKLPDRD